MTSSPHRSAGFTLIEVALAATILLVGFAGMIEALAVGTEMLDTARKQTIAAQVIQGEIEYLRMQDTWGMLKNLTNQAQIPLTTDPANPNNNYHHLAGSSATTRTSLANIPYRSLTYGWDVTTVRSDGSGNPILLQVTITVKWASITGKLHSRSSSVYLGKYGLNVSYQK
jgi:Tfp pilus assembly protein PilV